MFGRRWEPDGTAATTLRDPSEEWYRRAAEQGHTNPLQGGVMQVAVLGVARRAL